MTVGRPILGIGRRSPISAALDEHYEKHGAEVRPHPKQDYLKQAQLLRDARPVDPILEPCGATASSRFDRQTGAFIAFNLTASSDLLQTQRRRALLAPLRERGEWCPSTACPTASPTPVS